MFRSAALATALIIFSMASVHAQTLDSALAYFPMTIGNTWEYASYFGFVGPPSHFTGYGSAWITGDTLLPNGKVYRVFHGANIFSLPTDPSYFRMDSTSADVYSYDPFNGRDYLWDSLRASLGDRDHWAVVTSVHRDTILGTPTVTKVSAYVGSSLSLSYGIGVIAHFYEDDKQQTHSSRLVYAKINGKEYGTFLAIAPTAPANPSQFELLQNYPNPFNPSTIIRYALPERSHVILSVFNTLGQQVATLMNGSQNAGYHEVKFDGTGFASGVYYYQLQAGDFMQSRRLVLLK